MKALIAMSGGVDSSVAAKLTLDAGYECVGCMMKLYEADGGCCSADDAMDARSVAFGLGMPFYVFNFCDGFRKNVIERFAEEYLNGRTPNPCIDCNSYMKFDALLRRAEELGCDKIVTGHYARVEKSGEKYLLKKAADLSKDQSYVLYRLTQKQLGKVIFPLGEMTKSETRAIAESCGFVNSHKKDSQDICFAPDGDYPAALERLCGVVCPEGDFVDVCGNVIGRHRGIIRYTVGQHKGLGGNFPERMYVLGVNAAANTVTLGTGDRLFSRELVAGRFNWISGEPPAGKIRCSAKVRYRQTEKTAVAEPLPDGRVRIVFDEPQRAITPGQSAVLYDGDIVLGGGVIVENGDGGENGEAREEGLAE